MPIMQANDHPAMRQYLNLNEFFYRARTQRYCVLSNFESLPIDAPAQIDMLAEGRTALLHLWNLQRLSGNIYRTEQTLTTGQPLRLRIFEKGKRTFPESFETRILNRRVMHRQCVMVPDHETYFLVRLYWRVFFEDLWTDPADQRDRAMLIEYIKRQVGEPIAPKDKSLELNKKRS